jgi:hypothetical protein
MGFFNALGALAPLAPAQAEATDIRRQRAAEIEKNQLEAQEKRAQIQEAQQRVRAGNQAMPFGPLYKDKVTGKMMQPAIGPNGLTAIPAPWGQTPEEQNKQNLELFDQNVSFLKQKYPKSSDDDIEYMAGVMTGFPVKPPARMKQVTGELGKPFKGLDGLWYVKQYDENTGQYLDAPLGPNYQPPPSSRPVSRDDKYINIMQKVQLGQPLSPDEASYRQAYDFWVNKTKVAPGVARALAFGDNRYVTVIDPENPESVTFMRAGDAAKMHASSPQSLSFQVDKAIQKAFTSGTQGENLASINTLINHLGLLQQATDALGNGNILVFNNFAQRWAQETGSPVPTNFETMREAVSAELARTLKGSGATDQEISATKSLFDIANSPAQLNADIQMVTMQMNGRIEALKSQYESGKSGQPAFPGATPPSSGAQPKDPNKDPLGLFSQQR